MTWAPFYFRPCSRQVFLFHEYFQMKSWGKERESRKHVPLWSLPTSVETIHRPCANSIPIPRGTRSDRKVWTVSNIALEELIKTTWKWIFKLRPIYFCSVTSLEEWLRFTSSETQHLLAPASSPTTELQRQLVRRRNLSGNYDLTGSEMPIQ